MTVTLAVFPSRPRKVPVPSGVVQLSTKARWTSPLDSLWPAWQPAAWRPTKPSISTSAVCQHARALPLFLFFRRVPAEMNVAKRQAVHVAEKERVQAPVMEAVDRVRIGWIGVCPAGLAAVHLEADVSPASSLGHVRFLSPLTAHQPVGGGHHVGDWSHCESRPEAAAKGVSGMTVSVYFGENDQT